MNIWSSSMRGPQLRSEARITRSCQSAARHPELTHRSRTTSRGCRCDATSSTSSEGSSPHCVSSVES
eukprot:2681101-Prymnesium_polylepis.1